MRLCYLSNPPPHAPTQGNLAARARIFRRVPYAAPPVGALRWQPPRPPTPWGPRTLQATTDAPGCPQYCGVAHSCPAGVSEDCLFLNVFTPRLAQLAAPAPVLLFIHGTFDNGGGGVTLPLVLLTLCHPCRWNLC